MISNGPIRLNPATWPRMFYVWLAFIVAGGCFQFGDGFSGRELPSGQSHRGISNPLKLRSPDFPFNATGGYHVAELAYTYSIAGTLQSGRYKREFPTKGEAEEFIRDLNGKPVPIHYNPTPSSSAVLLVLQ